MKKWIYAVPLGLGLAAFIVAMALGVERNLASFISLGVVALGSLVLHFVRPKEAPPSEQQEMPRDFFVVLAVLTVACASGVFTEPALTDKLFYGGSAAFFAWMFFDRWPRRETK